MAMADIAEATGSKLVGGSGSLVRPKQTPSTLGTSGTVLEVFLGVTGVRVAGLGRRE
jgi:hypothetical protein